jgi:hypothetical protein
MTAGKTKNLLANELELRRSYRIEDSCISLAYIMRVVEKKLFVQDITIWFVVV